RVSTKEYSYVVMELTTAQTAAIGSIASGPLLRTTEVTYLVNDPAIDANTRAAYRARNLLALPTSTTIYQGAALESNVVAKTAISYDEGGQLAQLNDYGSVLNWTDPQTP